MRPLFFDKKKKEEEEEKQKQKQNKGEPSGWLIMMRRQVGGNAASQPASQCHASKVTRLFAGYTGHGNFMNEHMSAITVCVCVRDCVLVCVCVWAWHKTPDPRKESARERERPHTHKNSQVSILRLWATGSSTKAPKGRASK